MLTNFSKNVPNPTLVVNWNLRAKFSHCSRESFQVLFKGGHFVVLHLISVHNLVEIQ